jgi:cyanophycinase-like exopeptidase
MTNTAQSAAMQTIAKRGGSITDTSAGAAKVAVNEALT